MKFVEAMYVGQPTDSPITNPVSNLRCFQPFTFKTVLEPRYLISNYKPASNRRVVISTVATMSEPEIIYNLKAQAILNILGQRATDETIQAISLMNEERKENEELNKFWMKLIRAVNDFKRFRGDKLNKFRDPITNWLPDKFMTPINTSFYYLTDDDVVYDENGNEVGPKYIFKIIKSQTERLGGIKCHLIRAKTWNELEDNQLRDFLINLGVQAQI